MRWVLKAIRHFPKISDMNSITIHDDNITADLLFGSGINEVH